MKYCLNCHNIFSSSSDACVHCRHVPVRADGFLLYAPQFSRVSSGFKESYFSELAALEEKNFWFKIRNRLICWVLGEHGKNFQSFLEIGCGTGYVLSGVEKEFSGIKLVGSEVFVEGLRYAARRASSATFIQMDATAIPYRDEFDAIGAFDVIEHIKEDVVVLHQMHAALKEGGVIIISVPQHMWLWSAVDDYACHIRRYSKKELHEKLSMAGFNVVYSTSFVSLLLPALFFSRIKKRKKIINIDSASELKIPGWLNFIFYKVMQIEFILLKSGIRLRAGGSLLVVATKDGVVKK